MIRKVVSIVALLLVTSVLAGCRSDGTSHEGGSLTSSAAERLETAVSEDGPSTAIHSAQTIGSDSTDVSQSQVTGTPSNRVELPASFPEGSTLLGQLSSVHGIAELGPFRVRTRSIAVYVRCNGPTSLHVEIPEVATFDQQCTADTSDLGTLNTFDVGHVSNVLVRGTSDDANIWALAVTEYVDGG